MSLEPHPEPGTSAPLTGDLSFRFCQQKNLLAQGFLRGVHHSGATIRIRVSAERGTPIDNSS
jgi:hypothetical protein